MGGPPNGYTYDAQDRLHVTWVWRERTQGANHDLQYAFSEDRGYTWRNSQGQIVGDSRKPNQVIRLDSPGITVVPIAREHYLMNTHGQAVDSHGRIHTVMWHATAATLAQARDKPQGQFGPADARRYHHYWRGDDGTWQHTELPGVAGNRPKLFFDKQDTALLIFSGRQPEAELDSRSVYFNQGALIIMALADWILPFVYNIGFPGFQASVLVWLFLGGLVFLESLPPNEVPCGAESTT